MKMANKHGIFGELSAVCWTTLAQKILPKDEKPSKETYDKTLAAALANDPSFSELNDLDVIFLIVDCKTTGMRHDGNISAHQYPPDTIRQMTIANCNIDETLRGKYLALWEYTYSNRKETSSD